MKLGIAVISGFTETERKSCGLDTIQRDLAELYKPAAQVEVYDLRSWKADMKGLASLMKRDGITHTVIIAYSHGAGYASPLLSRYLDEHNISVKSALLCDPVYRPQWLPRWTIAQLLSIRSLIPKSAVIKFPANVQSIKGVRQVQNIPRAHPVIIEGREKSWEVSLIDRPSINHSCIDEAPEFRNLVFNNIAKILKP
tara:strand:+ start:110 stop:700 length:591 start_codon:yes stop_codon:yes gene_type:complete